MGIVEILILVAFAVVVFIVIRKLPDTRPVSDVGGAGSFGGAKVNYMAWVQKVLMILAPIGDFLMGLFTKIKSRFSKSKAKVDEKEVLKKQLKRPEDRDFWIEDQEVNSKAKHDLISKAFLDDAEEAFKAKDYRKAESLFLKVAKENPKSVKAFNRLGVIYLEQKNYMDAIEAFSTALKLDDKVCSRYYNLAGGVS